MTKQFTNRLNKELNQQRESYLHRKVRLYTDYRHNLASNDYFQLRFHPKVISGAQIACEKYDVNKVNSEIISEIGLYK